MSISLRPGNQLLRITLVTPANFGASGGNATVDRPLLLNVWSGLPVLPDTALKGVIAGKRGNVYDGAGRENSARTSLFGHADGIRGMFQQGTPSKISFGDGELLCFPCLAGGGGIALVFPVQNLLRFAKFAALEKLESLNFLDEDDFVGNVPASNLPTGILHRKADVHLPSLASLVGHPATKFIIAGQRTSSRLWKMAVEERMLTAVDNRTSTAKGGSLRCVEMVPAGTVLLSYVTTRALSDVPLLDTQRLQLGAWENIGCGFVKLEIVELPLPTVDLLPPDWFQGGPSVDRRPEHEIMVDVFRKVHEVAQTPEAAHIRTIVKEFGPRWRTKGFGPTLSFCLAKAKLETQGEDVSSETKAYRWVLGMLLNVEGPSGALLSAACSLIAAETSPGLELESIWVWLCRYSESMLI